MGHLRSSGKQPQTCLISFRAHLAFLRGVGGFVEESFFLRLYGAPGNTWRRPIRKTRIDELGGPALFRILRSGRGRLTLLHSRLIFQCVNKVSKELRAFTDNGLQLARNFTGHREQQVWIELEFTGEAIAIVLPGGGSKAGTPLVRAKRLLFRRPPAVQTRKTAVRTKGW